MSEANGGSTGRRPGRGVGDTNILRYLRQCWRHENRQLERGMTTGHDGTMSWATFAGKATVTSPSGETVGNQEFLVRVTDDPDSFWVEVLNKAGEPIGPLSMARDSAGQPLGPIVLSSGDLVVPKGNKKK